MTLADHLWHITEIAVWTTLAVILWRAERQPRAKIEEEYVTTDSDTRGLA